MATRISPTWKNRTRLQDAITGHVDWQNANGSFYGVRRNHLSRYDNISEGLLHQAGQIAVEQFRQETQNPGIDYVIYSYSTPIAWYAHGLGWRTVDHRWSTTTSKHQSNLYFIQNIPGHQHVGFHDYNVSAFQRETLDFIGGFPAGVPIHNKVMRRSANLLADRRKDLVRRHYFLDGEPMFVLTADCARRLGHPTPTLGLAEAVSMSGVLL